MKKRDIRRGTLLTMAFVAVVYVVMLIVIISKRDNAGESEEQKMAKSGVTWTDTLRNESSTTPALSGMDAEIERFRGRWNIKGMSIAVSRHDSLLFAKGYGYADMEKGQRLTPGNIMRMASASKLVTAVAIMKLVEQGKLRLDDPVFASGGLLHDIVATIDKTTGDTLTSISDKRHYAITVDHLLRHTGGFTLGAGDPMFNTKDIILAKRLKAPPSNEELVRIVTGRRLGFSPGAGRRYSNFGYFLLSLIIEKASGMSYWDYVTQNVLNPAGCYGFRPATTYLSQRGENEVKYYGPDEEEVEEYNGSGRMVPRIYGGSNVNGLMGAGGWCASAAEVNRLVAAIDKDPRVKDILSPGSIDTLTAHSDKEKLSRGWSEVDGHGKWSRTGTLSSTHALIERFPDGECWVILTNTGVWTGHHFSHDLSRLIQQLRSRHDGKLPRQNLWKTADEKK